MLDELLHGPGCVLDHTEPVCPFVGGGLEDVFAII
jgi:hypothetical protein